MSGQETPTTRPVEFSGHQQYYRATFHRWVTLDDGKTGALLEYGNGAIGIERQIYALKFLDRSEAKP